MVEDYMKYRWFFTSSGRLIIGGKSSSQNEEIMQSVDSDDVIMHTATPGSPFCVIKNPEAKDVQEGAIFTACFSHEWKKQKKKTEVHIFKGEQVKKQNGMKQGTFGIIGDIHKKKVDLKLVLTSQKKKIRAVPPTAAKKKFLVLTPGDLDKEQATKKILKILKAKYDLVVPMEDIMSAIPADNINVKA